MNNDFAGEKATVTVKSFTVADPVCGMDVDTAAVEFTYNVALPLAVCFHIADQAQRSLASS